MLAASGRSARAGAVIEQGDNAAVAWQAESYDRLDGASEKTWQLASIPQASGGKALVATAATLTPSSADAVYRLRFSRPGKYSLYVRYRGLDQGSDSLFFSNGKFDAAAETVRGFERNGDFYWQRITATASPYVVADADVDKVLELRIGMREPKFVLDRLVLVPDWVSEKLAVTDADQIKRLSAAPDCRVDAGDGAAAGGDEPSAGAK